MREVARCLDQHRGLPDRRGRVKNDVPKPLPWKAPQPLFLPTLRETLALQMREPFIRDNVAALLRDGFGTINPDPTDVTRAAGILLGEEHRRLTHARLMSVNAEMTDVAVAAGLKLPRWMVRREDVPAAAGLMVFDKPIAHYVSSIGGSERATLSIVAASWGPTALTANGPSNLWVSFWAITPHAASIRYLRSDLGLSQAKAAELSHRAGDLTWDNEVILTFDESDVQVAGDSVIADPSEHAQHLSMTLSWIQTVRAAWILMKPGRKRPITDVEELALPKNLVRRMERDGHGFNTSPVQVVRLHREPRRRSAAQSVDGYTMTIQYHVGGHVRWQPYPSLGVIEPIWIDDQIRGPEGAPLKPRTQTVTVLDRMPRT